MQATTYKVIAGEQKTDEWQKLREGKITGSVAKKVKGTGNAFLYETLAVMTSNWKPKEARGVDIDRGNELEPEARAAYEKHTGVMVYTVSFIENGRYGYSPDGLIFKNKKGAGIAKLVEIKCPDVNTHIKNIIENKVPSEYIDQLIHGLIVVDDCDEIDFVSYCPAYKRKPLHIVNVKRQSYIVDISTTQVQYSRFLEKLDKAYELLIL